MLISPLQEFSLHKEIHVNDTKIKPFHTLITSLVKRFPLGFQSKVLHIRNFRQIQRNHMPNSCYMSLFKQAKLLTTNKAPPLELHAGVPCKQRICLIYKQNEVVYNNYISTVYNLYNCFQNELDFFSNCKPLILLSSLNLNRVEKNTKSSRILSGEHSYTV